MFYLKDGNISIRTTCDSDLMIFATAEDDACNYYTTAERLRNRMYDMKLGNCVLLTAEYDGEPAGYICIYPYSYSCAHNGTGYPDVSDIHVLERFRNKGIDTKLMDIVKRVSI